MTQEQLSFVPKEENDGRTSIGNGYAMKWAGPRSISVFRYGVPFKHVEIKAGIDKRRLAVELILDCGVVKSRLAEALKVSRQSLDNWINSYRKAGFEGLVNSYKGSRRSGREQKSGKLPTGNKAVQLAEERRQNREEAAKRQLAIEELLERDDEQEGNNVRTAAPESGEDSTVSDDFEREGEDLGVVDRDIRDAEERPEKPKLPDIFEETYDFRENRYAGSFLYWGIFQHYFDFMDLCSSIFGRFSLAIYLFAMMLINKVGSVEQLKTVYKREFGSLIGIKQLYSIPVIWKIIHYVCWLKYSRTLIEEFFRYQAKKGLVALSWLYIDGHFIPYYGKETVHKGFYTQRDQMMPGQTEMFVHDCKGRIVYFEIQEGKGDLKEMMLRMSTKWAAYTGGTPPLIVADREAWGVEHFIEMKDFRFVTWEKYSKPEELASIPDDDFGPVFSVNCRDYQAREDKKTYRDDKGNSIELRRIVIWNRSTGKRVACVTGDEGEDNEAIATAMLGRWGCSENAFKYMGERCNMHYDPAKDASKQSGKQEIENPAVKKLRKELARLKKELSRTERDLGRLPLTKKKDGTLRKSKRRDDLQKCREELKEKIADVSRELDDCPQRIELNEVTSGKTFKELDVEGKNLWDLAESLVWNSRKKLIQMFETFLPNPRDSIPVLEAITQSRGWVRSTKEVLEVRLEPLETARFRTAQIQLCRSLNEKAIRLSNGKRLLYDVGPAPANVQK